MEILEITMKHFGKFTDQTMKFHPGINVIYGENETGKSTMRAFIKGMFFGIDKLRGRASETDEYNLRSPWENSSYFAGSLRLECRGKIYRIDRNFEKKQKEVQVICENDGTEIPYEDAKRMLLDGMEEAVFSNTVFFGGPSGQTDESLASAVRNAMINANISGDSRIDASGALERLKGDRKRLEREKKQKMAEKIEKLQELSMKIEYTEQEMEELATQEQKYREEFAGKDEESPDLQEEWLQSEKDIYREKNPVTIWQIGKFVMAAIAAGALATGVIMTSWKARVGAVAVILLSCLGVYFFSTRNEKHKNRLREQELERKEQWMKEMYHKQHEKLKRQRGMAPKRDRLQMNIEWTANARKEKQVQLRTLKEEHEMIRQSQKEAEELEQELSAVYLAIDTLEEVTAETYREYANKMNARISEILAYITGGKYTGIFLDENFQVRINTPQKLLSIWQVSRGTMEQIYFALRMACIEFLNPGEAIPLILDDAFITYDDTRLKNTLQWLSLSGRQILLFTCHRREQEIIYSLSQENG